MKIALVGNQNSGKTTLFNLLTGANQKVGNWAGVTIDMKSGVIKGTKHELVDLPGIYSLSPYTLEEEISRKFVFEQKPNLIINIIDATSIERSLYLTTQLLELDAPVIIALNMMDLLERKGLTIDIDKLSDELGVKIIPVSALKNTGIDTLIDYIKNHKRAKREKLKIYPDDIEQEIAEIIKTLEIKNKRFVAVKLLEKDKLFTDLATKEILYSAKKIEVKYKADMEEVIADERYNYIVRIRKKTVVKKEKNSKSDKLDKIFLHKIWGIPIFAAIMFTIYYLAIGLFGNLTIGLIEDGISQLSDALTKGLGNVGASAWAISLVVDGILAGVGAILSFVPQLMILFLCISILETTGYMARIAFMLDRLFKKVGLSGKSLIPFIIGSGCSVPGIMASRTVEDKDEHEMTAMLTPFVPCSAKLPVIVLFIGFFFGSYSGLVTVALYFLAIGIILISAIIMKKFFYKGTSSAFISELPDYKTPSVKYVTRDVLEHTLAFIKKAGTIIFLASIVVWILSSFKWNFNYTENIEESILAGIGNAFAWLFYPMLGEWSWAASVSAIQGFIAKEQTVSTMTIIAGLSDGAESTQIFGGEGIFSFFTPASAFAFVAFNMFSMPCITAVAAMKTELKSKKKLFFAIGFQMLAAILISYLIFGLGRLIMLI